MSSSKSDTENHRTYAGRTAKKAAKNSGMAQGETDYGSTPLTSYKSLSAAGKKIVRRQVKAYTRRATELLITGKKPISVL